MATRGRKPTGKTTTPRSVSFPIEFYAQLQWLALANNRKFSNMVVHLAKIGIEHAQDLRNEKAS